MIRTISSTFLASGILIAAYFGVLTVYPELEHKQFYAFLVFFSGMQILTEFVFQKLRTEEDAEKFVMTFMVATGVKFILSLFIVLILVTRFPDQKQLLALSFCIQYVIFLVVDSLGLLKKIKQRN